MWRCGDTSWISFFNSLSLQPLKSIVCSFCEERSSQSNHAGKQRPCATQSELSLSCSGALNARSECSITGPEPRACTSTGCTGSTATSLQDGTTVAIPRKEMIMASFHFGTFRLGSREQKLFSILSFRPRQKKTGVFEQASSKLFDLFGYFILRGLGAAPQVQPSAYAPPHLRVLRPSPSIERD